MPVFIPLLILGVEDVLAGVGPAVATDIAQPVVGDRFGRSQVVHRTDPHIENALHRCQIAEPFSIRADPCGGLLRIAKQYFSGNQLELLSRCWALGC